MTDRVGQRLDIYQLIRLLGTGSFGEVYLAEHVYRKDQVAVKVLPQLADSDLQSFLNEARSVRLKHPHIVQIRDFGVDKDKHVPFIVMDYAPHGTLRQRYPKGTHLPLASIVTYVGQIASALQYAHDERLIHRDVKPENLLVGTRSEVLVSDFGIATIARSSRSRSLVEMAGTVAYMAPEQVQGKPDVASDQYALAIIVYEWLCGERPFNGTAMEVAVQQMVTAPAPLREKVPDLSPETEQVVMKALAKDPRDRFVNVQAFAVALEQAYEQHRLSLQPRSIAVHPVISIEPPSRPVPMVSRKRRTLMLLTLALSMLFIFSSFGGIYYLKLSLPNVDQKFDQATSLINQANPDKDAVSALQKLVAAQDDLRSAQNPFFTGPQADRFMALQNSLENKGKQAITNYNEHASIFSLCNTIANTSVLNLTKTDGQSPLLASVQQGQAVSSYLLAGDSNIYLLNGQKSQRTKVSLPDGTVPFLLASNGQRLLVVTKQAGQGSNAVSYALHVYKPGTNGTLMDDSNSPRSIDAKWISNGEQPRLITVWDSDVYIFLTASNASTMDILDYNTGHLTDDPQHAQISVSPPLVSAAAFPNHQLFLLTQDGHVKSLSFSGSNGSNKSSAVDITLPGAIATPVGVDAQDFRWNTSLVVPTALSSRETQQPFANITGATLLASGSINQTMYLFVVDNSNHRILQLKYMPSASQNEVLWHVVKWRIMQAPLFVRPLTEQEQAELEAGRRSSQGFTVRRSQMLLASVQGKSTPTIARLIGCSDQTVRNAIHDFHQRGLAALQPKSSRPHTTYEVFDEEGRERLRALLHQSPRTFGKETSIWTLQLAAEVSLEQGIASHPISGETVRNALKLLGVRWKRAKHWITSPDPAYVRKKKRRDSLIRLVQAHPSWALGFQDEVWWSRLAQPDQHRWVEADEKTRLQELQRPKAHELRNEITASRRHEEAYG